MAARRYSPLDRLLIQLDRGLRTSLGNAPAPERPSPAASRSEETLADADRRHAAGLMRINHTGEVCAQALYFGQAATASDPAVREQMAHAAREETDHLAWCEARLAELGAAPSVTNPVWYAGSFALGAFAGLAGDRWSLGFVVETERQVEAHLGDHLRRLPPPDERSRAIVGQMQADEADHARRAQQAGAAALPPPIPTVMALGAGLMKAIVYRI